VPDLTRALHAACECVGCLDSPPFIAARLRSSRSPIRWSGYCIAKRCRVMRNAGPLQQQRSLGERALSRHLCAMTAAMRGHGWARTLLRIGEC
jgi:hypothetical protein